MWHSFDVSIAQKYGVCKAILIHYLAFWIKKNIANEKHFHDGHFWTYNSAKALNELFPYMSSKKIARLLKELENDKIIISANYNKSKFDKTKWYAIIDKSIKTLYDIDFSNLGNGVSKNEQPIPVNKAVYNKAKEAVSKEALYIFSRSKSFEVNTRKDIVLQENSIKEKTTPLLIVENNTSLENKNTSKSNEMASILVSNDVSRQINHKNENDPLKSPKNENPPYQEIIDYLNRVCKKSFKATTDATRRLIRARWHEGFKLDDFKRVIDNKARDWLNDKKMSKYLRPQTLFNTKFEAYLNETNSKFKSDPVVFKDYSAEYWEEQIKKLEAEGKEVHYE